MSRPDLARKTSRYFAYILSATQKGYDTSLKRKFPVYFSELDELSSTPVGVLFLNNRVSIPPSLCKYVLGSLHSGH